MGQIDFPENSVNNYQSTLRIIPEERRYHLNHSGSLQSRTITMYMKHQFWP